MLFLPLLADVTSLFDPNWWFDRVGILGVVFLVMVVFCRAILPDCRALLRSHTELANTLNVNFPKQTSSLEEIERRQEKHSEQLTEIKSFLTPREARR